MVQEMSVNVFVYGIEPVFGAVVASVAARIS